MKKKVIITIFIVISIILIGFVSFLSLPYLLSKNKQEILSLNRVIGKIFNTDESPENKPILAQDKETANLKVDHEVKSNIKEDSVEENEKTGIEQINNNKIFVQTNQGEVVLPDPPSGFTWQRLKEINGWILKTESWYFLHEQKNATQTYFITKEEII